MATPTLIPPSTTAGGGAPAATPPRKNRTPLVIVVVVIALALICVGIFAIAGGGHQVAVPATTPQPTQPKATTVTTTAPAVPVAPAVSTTGPVVAIGTASTIPGVTTTTEPLLLDYLNLADGSKLTPAGMSRLQDLLGFATVGICHGDQTALSQAFATTADLSGEVTTAAEGCSVLLVNTFRVIMADRAKIFLSLGVTKDSLTAGGTRTKKDGFVRLTMVPDGATGSWKLGDYPTLMTPAP
jgi:hypothetical protein